jgi:tetratricopeptide (TPR) repeat protein
LNVLPDHASALNNMGRCFAAQGQLEEALSQFTQALQSNPDYMEARYNLGMTLLNLEQFDEAILEFQSILRRDPDFKPAQFGLSRAQALRQQPHP